MELKLENGDYCPDGLGGLVALSGREEMLQRVHFRLVGRRGAFPLMPTMGSQLYRVLREKPSARQGAAETYVREALAEEVGVSVDSVSLEYDGEICYVVVALHDGETQLVVKEMI